MKLLLFLFLSLLLTIQNGTYSIKVFLDYLQEKGYWDIIYNIKNIFGEEVAIDICTKLTESPNDCEEVVRIYMTTPSVNKCPADPLEKMKLILNPIDDPIIIKRLNDRILIEIIEPYCPL